MRGLAFLTAMLQTDSTSTLWHELSAGVACYRIAARAMRADTLDPAAYAYARQKVTSAEMTDLHLANRLLDLLEAASAHVRERADFADVLATRLMAYGVVLHERALYAPAADVFDAVANFPEGEAATRGNAMLKRAHALQLAGDLARSEIAYLTLLNFAIETGDAHLSREAEIGSARIAVHRQEYELAEAVYHAVLAEATRAHDTEIMAKAHNDLAVIAGERHDTDEVIRHATAALEHLPVGHERDRVEINLAIAYREQERLSEARSIAEHVGRHASDTQIVALAALLCYHLAIDLGDGIEEAAHAVNELALAPELAIERHEAHGRAYAKRKNPFGAVVEYQQMRALAQVYKFPALAHRADAALAKLGHGLIPAPYDYAPQSSVTQLPDQNELRA